MNTHLDPQACANCARDGPTLPQPLQADVAWVLSTRRQAQQASFLELCVPSFHGWQDDVPLHSRVHMLAVHQAQMAISAAC